jgi:hypothetical protein
LSSWGVAEMPWTGSFTRRSLSLMMRLGKPDMFAGDERRLREEELFDVSVLLVQVVVFVKTALEELVLDAVLAIQVLVGT